MEIAKYTISVGFRFEQREFRRLETQLKRLERRLAKFAKFTDKFVAFRIGKFSVDQKKLQFTLGNALDRASGQVVFEISRFAVHDRNLRAAMMRAGRRLNQGTVTPQTQQGSSGGSSTPRSTRTDYSRANYLHAGGAAGAFMRYGAGSLPLIGGMYGMGALNRANQELISTEIAAGAIFGDRASQAKNWLERHSDYVGYNYLETMPIFSSFMASSMPLMGYDTSLGVFEALAEFGRTRGTDSVGMKRAMTAIQQMASKGQVMQEELKLQLSEARGFGESRAIFAEANQIRKGGNKTGAEAAAELLKDMADGKVMSADILPIVASLYKELARGGIDAARGSSIAQQARFQNERTRQLRVFSESGGEEGFARFWGMAAQTMRAAQPLVKALAGTFEDLSKAMQAPVYLFEKMTDVLKFMSSETGIAEKNFTNLALVGGLMMTKWGRVAMMFSTMLIVLEDIAMGVSGEGDSFTGRFIKWMEDSGVVMGPFEKGLLGVSAAMLTIAAALKAISAATSLPGVPDVFGGGKGGKGGGWLAKLAPFVVAGGLTGAAVGGVGYGGYKIMEPYIDARNKVAERWNDPMSVLYNNPRLQRKAQSDIRNPDSEFFNNLPLWEERFTQMRQSENLMYMLNNQSKYGTPIPGVMPMSGNVEIKMDVNIQAANPEDFNQQFQERFKSVIQETLIQYSQKE